MNSVKIIDPTNLKFWHPWEGDAICRNNAAYNATLYGSPTYEEGAIGKGLKLDTAGQYGTIPNVPISSSTPFSVEVIFKVTNISADFMVLSIYQNVTGNFGWLVSYNFVSGKVVFYTIKQNIVDSWMYGGTISQGRIYHIIVTCDGTNKEITLNGIHYGPEPLGFSNAPANTAVIDIGRYAGVNYPNGVIYDSKLEMRYLSQKERSLRYFSKKHLFGG